MTDIKALNDAIDRSGIKKRAIAEALGISANCLTTRLNGTTEFKSSEIAILRDLLRLSNEDVVRIFLRSSVNEVHT